jgi:acyl-CoA hydrolase
MSQNVNKLMIEILYMYKIGKYMYGSEISDAESIVKLAKSEIEEIAKAQSARILRIDM